MSYWATVESDSLGENFFKSMVTLSDDDFGTLESVCEEVWYDVDKMFFSVPKYEQKHALTSALEEWEKPDFITKLMEKGFPIDTISSIVEELTKANDNKEWPVMNWFVVDHSNFAG